MAKENEVENGGQYMVQDHDHMSDQQGGGKAKRGKQADQSQAGGRQQGDDHGSSRQHGTERGGRQR